MRGGGRDEERRRRGGGKGGRREEGDMLVSTCTLYSLCLMFVTPTLELSSFTCFSLIDRLAHLDFTAL